MDRFFNLTLLVVSHFNNGVRVTMVWEVTERELQGSSFLMVTISSHEQICIYFLQSPVLCVFASTEIPLITERRRLYNNKKPVPVEMRGLS